MEKHFKTKSEMTKFLIEDAKDVIKRLEKEGKTRDLKFFNEHLKELEEQYNRYLEHDEPYYEAGTYGFYLNTFKDKKTITRRKTYFINVIQHITEDKHNPSTRMEKIENLVRAYKDIQNQSE